MVVIYWYLTIRWTIVLSLSLEGRPVEERVWSTLPNDKGRYTDSERENPHPDSNIFMSALISLNAAEAELQQTRKALNEAEKQIKVSSNLLNRCTL